ncbi:MAG: hypothetical protein H7178_04175 [Chitinophagaceae bacterium]|nr:hypothetical protein [Chitinophagaceae bacterium]
MAYDPNDNYIEETQLIKRIRVVTLITSFVLFGISLFNKCYCTDGLCRTSIEALLLGWFASITWLANPFLIITWVLISKNRKFALWAGLLTTLISFSFLKVDRILENEAGQDALLQKLKLVIGFGS